MKIFSKLNLISNYYQIIIKLKNRYKTIFQTRYNYYKFNIISFKLMNIFIIFQILINNIFRNLLNIYIIVYLDDILVYSKNENEYEQYFQ